MSLVFKPGVMGGDHVARRRSHLRAAVLSIAGALFVTASHSQSSGGIFSLGISDDAKVDFVWRANTEPNVAGYRLYVGTVSGIYASYVDVGRTTTFELSGLVRGMTYYFALTAYTTAGLESDFTPELTYDVPMLVETVFPASTPEVDTVAHPEAPFDAPPAISTISDHALSKNKSLDVISFTVSDIESSAAELQVIAFSSNPVILPSDGLMVIGSHGKRILIIDTANGHAGVATVTIEVTDGSSLVTATFFVTVGDDP